MEVLMPFGGVIIGLLILVVGGEVLLRGAVGLAKIFGLTPAVIGLTVVAAGTSVPELAVSAVAAFKGKADITVGNVVGSNICNIGLILGVVAVYRRLKIQGNTIKFEYPVMLLVTLAFIALSQDGLINRFEGLFLVAAYVGFVAFLIRVVRGEMKKNETEAFQNEVDALQPPQTEKVPNLFVSLVLTVAGVALLGFGADVTVSGATTVGAMFGMSERVIGLTIVAIGTSLPELVTSLVSSYRGQDDVAVANVIGSCIFNIVGIIGLTSLVLPVPVAPSIISSDNWWMLGATAVLFPIMRTGFAITRREGFVLSLLYTAYLVQLILNA